MSKFLKGNYEVTEDVAAENREKSEDLSKLFESRAFEKLGGSIAFVMKSDNFVWDEDEDEDAD